MRRAHAIPEHVTNRRRYRRNVATASLICGIILPTLAILSGLCSDSLAHRVSEMGAVLGALMLQAVGVVAFYMHVGSDETKTIIKESAT